MDYVVIIKDEEDEEHDWDLLENIETSIEKMKKWNERIDPEVEENFSYFHILIEREV